MKYIQHFFQLKEETVKLLQAMVPKWEYGLLGQVCFYRTYSRKMANGKNEHWADCVIRVINGLMSIRYNHYKNNNIEWDESYWQDYAQKLAVSMFEMRWLPPGRGLWAMGTDFVAERGSMALYNCAFTNLTSNNLGDDLYWFMDCLMCGVGVGFTPLREPLDATLGQAKLWKTYQIPDTREGWAESVRLIVETCTTRGLGWNFDYSLIRKKGEPIKGFGGTASGPEPLEALHKAMFQQFHLYESGRIDIVELKTNLVNLIGVCVVAGNVRRSAELGMAPITDPTFLDLKDYAQYPDRKSFGWMSNNTAVLHADSDFEKLGFIAQRVPIRGEPGIANHRNFPKGRVGAKKKYPVRRDTATGLNPCGEITLEHREVCNLAETFPTKCKHIGEWIEACEHAAFYCSTVSLLPTHHQSTNAVVMRNRRIGVSIVDWTNWIADAMLNNVVKAMTLGYKRVRKFNRQLNAEAGVPEAIKVTTIKPGGTVPKLAGRVSGIGFPTFNHTLRRVTIEANSPVAALLKKANVPYTVSRFNPNDLFFEFPFLQKGRPADQVSLWEQAFNLITVQRHWSDNAVSNTLYFRPKWQLRRVEKDPKKFYETIQDFVFDDADPDDIIEEKLYQSSALKIEIVNEWGSDELRISTFNPDHEEDILEPVMSHMAPHVKSASFLPHSAKGAYENMPEEGISEHEYHDRVAQILPVDWSELAGSDGQDEKYCVGDVCALPN